MSQSWLVVPVVRVIPPTGFSSIIFRKQFDNPIPWGRVKCSDNATTNQRVKTMRYLPTVNLWDWPTQRRVIKGDLKLQRGQWIRCGSDRLSRFVGVSSNGVIWAVHPGNPKDNDTTGIKFRESCRLFRG